MFEKAVCWSNKHRIASHFIFWVVAFIITLTKFDATNNEKSGLGTDLTKAGFFVLYYMIGSYFVAYLIIPQLIIQKRYVRAIAGFLLGSYVITVVIRILTVHILEPIVRIPPFEQESIAEIITDIPWLIQHYFIHFFSVAWIFGFFKLIKDQYMAQQQTLLLEKQKAETELYGLKAQLNPHFLFNTLNNIYSLSMMGSPVTSKSIAELSEILDHVINRCNDTYVPVSTEIALLHNYIGLEKLRYNERLRVDFRHHVDQDLAIAPLILLALTENAFKHGAGEDIGNPSIRISLELENRQFKFLIANTFVERLTGIPADRIGLNNIRKQLDLIYGPHYTLHISATDDLFAVLLQINLEAHGKT